MITEHDCIKLDQNDPLLSFKDQFDIPKNILYFDGNSLGALPKTTLANMQNVITNQWGANLINSWFNDGWLELPKIVGNKIAKLVGAEENEVVVADSTSINLFKAIYSAVKINSDRNVILTTNNIFPTDKYMAKTIADNLSKTLITVNDDVLLESLNEKVAVLLLTHVDHLSSKINDMQNINQIACKKGILTIWDLSHSVGAMKVELKKHNADFAVGCTYKFLNGGPGAPSFIFANNKHNNKLQTPLPGWFGHKKPFDFDPNYYPAGGASQYLCGTSGILGLTALDSGVSLFKNVDLDHVRSKSVSLTSLFVNLINQVCANKFEIFSPINSHERGSHVSLRHERAKEITDNLVKKSVIPDFRPPNIIRFGFAPLYMSHIDVWKAVMIINEII